MLLFKICSKCVEEHLCEISRSSDVRSRSQLSLKFPLDIQIFIAQDHRQQHLNSLYDAI